MCHYLPSSHCWHPLPLSFLIIILRVPLAFMAVHIVYLMVKVTLFFLQLTVSYLGNTFVWGDCFLIWQQIRFLFRKQIRFLIRRQICFLFRRQNYRLIWEQNYISIRKHILTSEWWQIIVRCYHFQHILLLEIACSQK